MILFPGIACYFEILPEPLLSVLLHTSSLFFLFTSISSLQLVAFSVTYLTDRNIFYQFSYFPLFFLYVILLMFPLGESS